MSLYNYQKDNHKFAFKNSFVFNKLIVDNVGTWQEPFVNIPEDTIREALKVVLGITITSTFK